MIDNQKYNILYITHISTLYGANKSLLNLISGLDCFINPIVIIPKLGPLSDELNKRGIKYYIINYKHSCVKRRGLIHDILFFIPQTILISITNINAAYQIKKVINTENICLLHTNSIVSILGYVLSKITKVKHIWHIREFLDLDYNIRFFLGKKILLKILKNNNNNIYISNSIRNHFVLTKNQITIYDGVLSKNRIAAVQNTFEKKNQFLFCGVLTKGKGLLDAIHAFGNFKTRNGEYNLIILGEFVEESFKNDVNELITSLNISDSIKFVGFVDNVNEYMAESKYLLMCSKNEALGRVTIEAMYNKCFVIGLNSAGTKEILEDSESGILYNNLQELELIMYNIVNNSMNSNDLLMNAQNYVLKNFSEVEYAKKILNYYERVLN